MTDSTNNKELVAAGHEFARHMSSDTPIIDIAKMVTRLASQLDVTTVALRQANAELKASVAAEIEWEKAMMKAVGEDGIADVVSAIEKLKADGAALAAENAALKNGAEKVYDEITSIHSSNGWSVSEDGESSTAVIDLDGAQFVVQENLLDIKTPATDAFIADQQAIGVENFSSDVGLEYQQLEPELKPGSVQEKALKNIVFRAVSFAKKLRDEVKS